MTSTGGTALDMAVKPAGSKHGVTLTAVCVCGGGDGHRLGHGSEEWRTKAWGYMGGGLRGAGVE